jgi:hypothetical protein
VLRVMLIVVSVVVFTAIGVAWATQPDLVWPVLLFSLRVIPCDPTEWAPVRIG